MTDSHTAAASRVSSVPPAARTSAPSRSRVRAAIATATAAPSRDSSSGPPRTRATVPTETSAPDPLACRAVPLPVKKLPTRAIATITELITAELRLRLYRAELRARYQDAEADSGTIAVQP